MSRTRIVKGNITKIIGGDYKRYSKEDIENIGSKVIQVGKEGGVIYGKNEEPPVAEIDILADAIVHFRPKKDWKGKDYGMDWMRIGDTNLFGDSKYEDLVGTYTTYPTPENIPSFTKNITNYNNLKKEYCNPVYKIPWLTEGRKIADYFATWLCVEKNKEVKLSLNIHIKDKKNLPKQLVIAYDKNLCEITSSLGEGSEDRAIDPLGNTFYTKLPLQSKSNYKLADELSIKVLTDITTVQTIKVLCDDKEAGFLKLYPNKVKKLNVVCVQTKTRGGTGRIKGKEVLTEYLKQALIKVNIEEVELDIQTNTDGSPNTDLELPSIIYNSGLNVSGNIRGKKLSRYLDEKLRDKFPNIQPDGTADRGGKYRSYLRLYFLDETAYLVHEGEALPIGGIGSPKGAGVGLMFETISDADVAHEAMHAIALGHSFGKNTDISTDTPYLFEYKKTENVMDYANLEYKDKYSTWKWQWDKLRNFYLLTDEETTL